MFLICFLSSLQRYNKKTTLPNFFNIFFNFFMSVHFADRHRSDYLYIFIKISELQISGSVDFIDLLGISKLQTISCNDLKFTVLAVEVILKSTKVFPRSSSRTNQGVEFVVSTSLWSSGRDFSLFQDPEETLNCQVFHIIHTVSPSHDHIHPSETTHRTYINNI